MKYYQDFLTLAIPLAKNRILTASDLNEIAAFGKIVKNYLKIKRLDDQRQ